MPCGIERAAHGRDIAGDPGRGLVVDHADRLDDMRVVFREARLDLRRIDAAPPVARQEQRVEPESDRDPLPERREVSGLDHQHTVAGRERVGKGRLPRAGPRRREEHHRVTRLNDRPHPGEHLAGQLLERGPAMVDGRRRHRAQHAVGHVGRPGNLQEMTSAGMSHGANLGVCATERNKVESCRPARHHSGSSRCEQKVRQRREIVDELRERMAIPERLAEALCGNDDLLDAAVCVLAAQDFLSGRAVPPTDRCLAERESWIWAALPRDATYTAPYE